MHTPDMQLGCSLGAVIYFCRCAKIRVAYQQIAFLRTKSTWLLQKPWTFVVTWRIRKYNHSFYKKNYL